MKLKKTSKIFQRTVYLVTQTKKTFLLLLVILVQTSCNKYPKRGESINKGEIVGNYQDSECYSMTNLFTNTCVIKSMVDFDSILQGSSCINTPTNFDFNSFSIIGQRIKFKCNSKIIREVKIDHSNKLYTYTVKFKDVGTCMSQGSTSNLVIVPKIPADYNVEFKVKED